MMPSLIIKTTVIGKSIWKKMDYLRYLFDLKWLRFNLLNFNKSKNLRIKFFICFLMVVNILHELI